MRKDRWWANVDFDAISGKEKDIRFETPKVQDL